MTSSGDEQEYDAAALKVLADMKPKPPGYTATWDDEFEKPEECIRGCDEILSSDPRLWFVRVVDFKGRRLIAYRDPYPGE